ncbi:ABC transporter permease [Thalassomonas actiniarum]|uniref:FtsX-like permease family protein n=1 Tax=Thalassomonas actiniarum TaxID=485447 RepID=A0AAE9YIR8_9GAMM|nr:FtsX-like permease family protein [Thalassomonas actiniarum]WDD96750.1 FtsX-like permease family protein [Thalassomonas actiniarum]
MLAHQLNKQPNQHLLHLYLSNMKLAWHFFKQEYQHSHQRLLRWTQGVLLLFILTLGQSSESIQHYLNNNLQGLLGADAVISQQQSLTAKQRAAVSELTDEIVVTEQIKTTLTHKGQWQQVTLKAVDEQYPLQGQLLTSQSLFAGAESDKGLANKAQANGQATASGPKPGEIWADARLFASLSLSIGDVIQVAEQHFKVSRVLHHEPDRLMEGHNVDMRAMIHVRDMETLGFAADLIHYRYLIAANSGQINRLIKWQQEVIPAAQMHHKQGAHPLALFWQRTENFLGLASIILFFMAAIAIDQLAQVHMKKDQYFSAICMSLGVTKATGIQVSFFKWLMGIVCLLPVVLLFSTAFHYFIIHWLSETFIDLNWQWHFWPALKSIGFVIFVFAVFHAPVWVSLRTSSVARLFTGNNKGVSHWVSKVSSILVLVAVATTYSDNGLLTLMLVTAIALTILLMIAMSWGALTLGEKSTKRFSGLIPFTLFMMKQRLVSKSTQILGVGLCAFLLLFTLMLLKDLGATMTAYQRQHDGNVMVSQASEQQLDYIEHWAAEQGVKIRQAKPYMYAKLLEVNGQSLAEFSQKPSDSMATFNRPIRLHWNEALPQNNEVAEGLYWNKKRQKEGNEQGNEKGNKQGQQQDNSQHWQQVSVEQEVMTDLGLDIGDKLTFFIGQQSITFNISASHVFKPGAGSITFWVQMPQAGVVHIQAPRYSMASLELEAQQWSLLPTLWQKFPTLRMVSLKELTERFDVILAMITKVISGFSLMIVLLATVVILASISALEGKEKKKNSIIMSFGFSKTTCLHLNVIEWLVTALITATGAIAGTYIAGLLIYQSQFSLTYQPNFIWLLAALSAILLLVAALGVYASRRNLQSSVRQLMAEG